MSERSVIIIVSGVCAGQISAGASSAWVADVFDALAHKRVYKAAWSLEEAVAEIRAQSGRQFDPRVVVAFEDVLLAAPG